MKAHDPTFTHPSVQSSSSGKAPSLGVILLLGGIALASAAVLWTSIRSIPDGASVGDSFDSGDALASSALHREVFPLADGSTLVAEFRDNDDGSRLWLRNTPRDGTRPASAWSTSLDFHLRDVRLDGSETLLLSGTSGERTTSARIRLSLPLETLDGALDAETDASPVAPPDAPTDGRGPMALRGSCREDLLGPAIGIGERIASEIERDHSAAKSYRPALATLFDLLRSGTLSASPDVADLSEVSATNAVAIVENLAVDSAARGELLPDVTALFDAVSRSHRDHARIARVVSLAMKNSIELAQGLPEDHTSHARLDSVKEFLVHRHVGNELQSTSLMRLEGVALVEAGAHVLVEVGQFLNVADFEVWLSVDGGEELNVVPGVSSEPAVPVDLYEGVQSASKIAHMQIDLPDGTRRFDLWIRHSEKKPIPGLRSWYFGVDDFGRQERLEHGYEATVLLDRPIDWRTLEAYPAEGEGFLLLEATGREADPEAHADRIGPVDDLAGFRVEVGPDHRRAMVIYEVQAD